MYEEKINSAIKKINNIEVELRDICLDLIKEIMSYAKTEGAHTINVSYYTESEIESWNFTGIDGNGYGSALFIGDIDTSNIHKPIFAMLDEDGDDFEDRNLDDFECTELTYLVRMLSDLLDVVKEDDDVKTEYEW